MQELLEGSSFSDLLGAVAAKQPAPGGGAVASMTGAISVALAQMVVNYSIGKKKLAAHETALQKALDRLDKAKEAMLELAHEDAAAYELVNGLMKLPADDDRRIAELLTAVRAATQAPMSTAAAGVNLLRLYDSLAPMTNPYLHSDLVIAAILAQAAVDSSAQNVKVNLPLLEETIGAAEAGKASAQIEALVISAAEFRKRFV
jgi:methenyltetrahydrofolate cyclohydrolase